MSLRLRHPAVVAVLLMAAAAAVGWTQLQGYFWTDYEAEAETPLGHLVGGRFELFAQTAPGYGGSLLIRAPFALLPSLWGGGPIAVYRSMAAVCLLAGAGLGWVLWRERGRRFPAAGWALAFALLAAANPLTFRTLYIGHPEDLLGAVLCVAAVLAAAKQRPWLAAVLLGLAIGNKAWGVLAIGPVLVALHGRRLSALVLAGVIAGAVMAPFALVDGGPARVVVTAGTTSTIFQPWQVWWPLGDAGDSARSAGDARGADAPPVWQLDDPVNPGYRTPPAWLSPVTHPLIAFLVIPLTLLWLRRRRGEARGAPEDALLLLALLMLLRCVLDPWNLPYYHLPFVFALLAWEAVSRARPPVWSLLAVALVWVSFEALPSALPPDAQSAAYLMWALPAVVILFRAAYGPGRRRASGARQAAPVPVAA